MNRSNLRRRVVVHGKVQGVFFRDTCWREAVRHGVSGWVCNRPDGAVEAVFEGEAEAVDAMVEWAQRGPQDARVHRVEAVDEPVEGLAGFEVRHS